MARGDHVYVSRRRYSHHGIDCGDGTVIHFASSRPMRRVERAPIEEFAAGGRIQVRSHPDPLGPEEVVRRAESLIGTVDYHLLRNNCEHVATWCCTGHAASSQVRRWRLALQGACASVLVGPALGTDVALAGTFGAGVYALAGPLRRR